MPKIFISYRRADATDAAGRMFDRLVAAFGDQHVFKDVDSIPLGSEFGQVIAERLTDCDVVIVVIGRFWLNVKDRDGTPRLENPADYVRIEIEQALASRALVIPALVGNMAMPREEQLPESMRKLTRRHALSVRPDPDFHRDMDRLIHALQDHERRKNSAPPKVAALLPDWLAPEGLLTAIRLHQKTGVRRPLMLLGGLLGFVLLVGVAAFVAFLVITSPRPLSTAPVGKPSAYGRPTPTAVEPAQAEAPFDAAKAKQLQQEWADYLKKPVDRVVDLGNGVTMKLTLIPPGTFPMGSPEGEADRNMIEGPQHRVKITDPFYMGVYPVTKAQFAAFVKDAGYQTEAEKAGDKTTWLKPVEFGWSADYTQTDDDPVVEVSWNDAVKFCDWLAAKGKGRCELPTEAQWEYACRAGTQTAYFFGGDAGKLGEYAWDRDNSERHTHPVGGKKPNPWGLYDMSGNVSQWCQDYYGPYSANEDINPIRKDKVSVDARVLRGGSWGDSPEVCRAAYRDGYAPGSRGSGHFGLRSVSAWTELPFLFVLFAILPCCFCFAAQQRALKLYDNYPRSHALWGNEKKC